MNSIGDVATKAMVRAGSALVAGLAALVAGLALSAAAAGAPRQPVIAGSGASPTELAGVSCTGPSWCMAVGHFTDRSGTRHALAQIWNGTSWQVLKPHGRSLSSVSCSARWFCMASGGPTGAERWNGLTWQTLASPNGGVQDVSCGTRKLCMIITGGVVAAWNGQAWVVLGKATNVCAGPPGFPCGLASVACGSGTNCLAVGTTTISQQPLQQTVGTWWDGRRWHYAFPPNDGNPAEMNVVSCNGSFCMAAGGNFSEPANGGIALAASYDAKTGAWTDVSPNLGVLCTGPLAVCNWATVLSCGSTTNCMALGPQGNQWWNGTSWQSESSISVGLRSNLGAVSCSGSTCLVVGYRTIRGAAHTLAETWNGTTWRVLNTPSLRLPSVRPHRTLQRRSARIGCCLRGRWEVTIGMTEAFGDVAVTLDTHHVALAEIRRPPDNFFDAGLIEALADAYDWLGADTAVRAVVLCSEGKNFCAGADFTGRSAQARPVSAGGAGQLYEQAARLFDNPLPVVAAVQGAAVGGGLGLACSADFRVASPSSRFCANFARLGLHQGFGLSVTLPEIIGQQAALDMLLTGRRVGGEEAARMGLADRLSADGEVRSAALELAADIAASAPLAVQAIRATMRAGLVERFRAATAAELAEQDRLRRTADFAEGVRASAERRQPMFEGQ